MSDNDASGTQSGRDEDPADDSVDATGGPSDPVDGSGDPADDPNPPEEAIEVADADSGRDARTDEQSTDRPGERADDRSESPDEDAGEASTGRAADDEESLASESGSPDENSVASKSGSPDTESLATESVSPDEIDPEELTVSVQTLNPRVRYVWILNSIVTSAIVGGILAAAAWAFDSMPYAAAAGVAGFLLVFGVVHSILRYRVWRYEVREDALYLERGVFTRVRTVVPFVRIQHVDTSRSVVERATGLASSVVYTAGSRGADVNIPGLEPDRAEDLQRRLKQLAIVADGDTAV